MPIVNYVREHIRFMEYATDEHLTSSERLLWYALMHIMNQRAQGKVWPDEFIRISNDRLLSYCPMKYDTIAAARNSLKQRGLIEFTHGEKNKKSPAYRMIYFYPEYVAPDTDSDADIPQSNSKKSEYIGGNMGGNIRYNAGGNAGGNMGGNIGDFNINNTGIHIPDRIQNDCDNDDQEQQDAHARAYAEAERAWKAFFGRSATPSMLNALAWRAGVMGFGNGVLAKAIEKAAIKGANSPVDYIFAVMMDWRNQGIKSVDDAEEYAFIYDACQGKSPGGASVEYGIDALQSFRERRQGTDDDSQHQRRRSGEKKDQTQGMGLVDLDDDFNGSGDFVSMPWDGRG